MSWLERRWYSQQPAPILLRPLEKLYKFLANRNKQRHLDEQWQAPVPVIVVGNITVGGTGKTPLVTFLVEQLKAAGYKPGIVSRGYKSQAPAYPYRVTADSSWQEAGDEPLLLAKRCDCPVVIDADRVAAAKHLLQSTDCDLIISDDGLQHYRLGRHIELIVIDGKRQLGNQHCLPAGPLRESPERLKEVDWVIFNGVAFDNPNLPEDSCTMQLQPTCLVNLQRTEQKDITSLKGCRVHAVAGIGNPQRFFNTLRQLSIEPVEHPKADHHAFTAEDFLFGGSLPVLMTEKDAVKAEELALDDAWYLEVSARLPDNFIHTLLAQINAIAPLRNKT